MMGLKMVFETSVPKLFWRNIWKHSENQVKWQRKVAVDAGVRTVQYIQRSAKKSKMEEKLELYVQNIHEIQGET